MYATQTATRGGFDIGGDLNSFNQFAEEFQDYTLIDDINITDPLGGFGLIDGVQEAKEEILPVLVAGAVGGVTGGPAGAAFGVGGAVAEDLVFQDDPKPPVAGSCPVGYMPNPNRMMTRSGGVQSEPSCVPNTQTPNVVPSSTGNQSSAKDPCAPEWSDVPYFDDKKTACKEESKKLGDMEDWINDKTVELCNLKKAYQERVGRFKQEACGNYDLSDPKEKEDEPKDAEMKDASTGCGCTSNCNCGCSVPPPCTSCAHSAPKSCGRPKKAKASCVKGKKATKKKATTKKSGTGSCKPMFSVKNTKKRKDDSKYGANKKAKSSCGTLLKPTFSERKAVTKPNGKKQCIQS